MADYPEQKPRTGTKSDFDQAGRGPSEPEIRGNQSNLSSNTIIAYIIAALVLIFGAYLLFAGDWSTTTTAPTTTQDSTTAPDAPLAPAPDAIAPITPVPATPPASDTTTPPATGTAPQQPVAPAQ